MSFSGGNYLTSVCQWGKEEGRMDRSWWTFLELVIWGLLFMPFFQGPWWEQDHLHFLQHLKIHSKGVVIIKPQTSGLQPVICRDQGKKISWHNWLEVFWLFLESGLCTSWEGRTTALRWQKTLSLKSLAGVTYILKINLIIRFAVGNNFPLLMPHWPFLFPPPVS